MQPDRHNVAPSANSNDRDTSSEDGGWLRRAQAAFLTSTTYIDNNLRKGWDDSIRAFNGQHPNDSKYNSPAYEKRSRLYRPKTRAVIRKNEAAAAAAFFSNMEVIDITPTDQSNKEEVASASIMKELMQYRLSKSIPWYQTVLGGLQDAQTVGVVCAHIYWEYKAKPKSESAEPEIKTMGSVQSEEYPEQADQLPPGALVSDGDSIVEQSLPASMMFKEEVKEEEKPISDKPVIDLIPCENLRIDPSADWRDPINSSPYVIHMMPMYVMDVKSKMKGGEWKSYGDGQLRAAGDTKSDSTRSARQKDRDDQYASSGKELEDYEICWIQRHIHRRDDEDYEFYTLGDFALLTTPQLLVKTVFHGKRPYVMGSCIVETHKIYPSGIPMLGKGLQDEANEVANQRIDNVKFVLNKKWFIKRGVDVDVAGLVRNVPGGVVSMNDPVNDVREVTWPDVTASAYEEQGRIDNDMNDLLGNFSAAQVMADHGINSPARNMAMLGQSAGTLVEYLLRTYVETFVQPVLRQLVLLEQHYETDQVILSIAAKKAKALQKYGKDEVTDGMLDNELTLTVNVGMGATDPGMKLQKFVGAMNSYVGMMKAGVAGINMQEVGKEIFGHLGYSDGSRFFTTDNPQVAQMQAQMQQMQQQMKLLHDKANDKMAGHQVKVAVAQEANQTKLKVEQLKQDAENLRNSVTHLRAIKEDDRKHQLDVHDRIAKHQSEMSDRTEEHKNPRSMKDANK